MNTQVTGFRAALGLIMIGSIVLSALSGALSGTITAVASGNSIGASAMIGAFVGAIIGWVLGSYAHGIGYTLLSINDHLAEISGTLKRGSAPEQSTNVTPQSLEQVATPHNDEDAKPSPTLTYREKFESLPVEESLMVEGLVVWKLRNWKGEIYYSGDRTYQSLDELLNSYKVT